MKIVKLSSTNIKRVKAVEITPEGDVVILSGKNNQGKSSVLDTILYALGGAKNVPSQPIRRGENSATATVETEEFIATRRFTPSGSTLTVKTKNGMSYPSPQKFLDGLVGRLSFDPLEFSRMTAPQRKDALVDLAGIREPLQAWEQSHREAIDAMNEARANLVTENEALAALRLPEPTDPTEALKLTDLLAEAAAQRARANNLDQLMARKTAQDEEVQSLVARIAALQERKQEKQAELSETVDQILKARKALAASRPVEQIESQLEQLEEQNEIVHGNAEYRRRQDRVAEAADRLVGAKAALAQSHNTKALIFADAKLPIKGLEVSDGEVLYKDTPFDQLSASMQLKVSLVMAMASNPELRVIRINDGSLLDSESMATIAKLAKKNDYQFWVEVVDETGELGIVIEDGSVKV